MQLSHFSAAPIFPNGIDRFITSVSFALPLIWDNPTTSLPNRNTVLRPGLIPFLHREAGEHRLALPVQQGGEPACGAGGVEEIVHTGLDVHPDFCGVHNSVGINFYKAFLHSVASLSNSAQIRLGSNRYCSAHTTV